MLQLAEELKKIDIAYYKESIKDTTIIRYLIIIATIGITICAYIASSPFVLLFAVLEIIPIILNERHRSYCKNKLMELHTNR
jgi:hypothetical protein